MSELLGLLRGRHMEEPAPPWEALTALGTPGPDGATPEPLELSAPDDRSLLARCARLNAGDGRAAGWIVAFADITPLREAERAREEVLAFLSHDMRSPQSSILALLELHELDPDDNPKEEVFKRIEHYARRTLSLSEQFLQLARAESKAHETSVEDLGALAEEAVDDVWTAAEQKSIKFTMQWDGEPVPVAADKPLLLRAITNLLTNAVKYSPENTTVTVKVAAREVEGQLRHVCEVADQGYGISVEDQAKLFERYRRFSAPGQPKAQGAGLGMAFVKTVIEKHGGHIGVASTLGQGSTFTLVLPPVEAEADA
jgi:signal transduction histidine kinase